MSKPPISDATRATILRLHGDKLGRNAIAREAGCSAATVTKVVTQAGGTFERGAEVAAATAAKVADAKARRAKLMHDLLDDADRLRGQLFAPAKAFNFGGKDNTYAETLLDEPMFADKRNLIQAVATAIGTSIKIDQHDRLADDPSDFDAWLTHLRGGEQ